MYWCKCINLNVLAKSINDHQLTDWAHKFTFLCQNWWWKKKKEKIAKVRLIYFYIDVLFQGTCEHVIWALQLSSLPFHFIHSLSETVFCTLIFVAFLIIIAANTMYLKAFNGHQCESERVSEWVSESRRRREKMHMYRYR